MRVEATAVTSRDVDALWRWWTDFGAAGEVVTLDHGFGRTRRRIVENDGTRVVFDDLAPALPGRDGLRVARHTVLVRAAERRLDESGDGPLAFTSEWTFTATPHGGARVQRVLHVESRVADALGRLARGVAERAAARDLRAHVRAFEREVARA